MIKTFHIKLVCTRQELWRFNNFNKNRLNVFHLLFSLHIYGKSITKL